jgi:hypothetical protein
VKVNTPIYNKNQNEIVGLMKYIKKKYPEIKFIFEPVRGLIDNKIKLDNIKIYFEIVRLWKKYFYNSNCITDKVLLEYYQKYFEKDIYDVCMVSSRYGTIDSAGNVYICESLPYIGNLRFNNYNYYKIWNSDIAKKWLCYIIKKKCKCKNLCFNLRNILDKKDLDYE